MGGGDIEFLGRSLKGQGAWDLVKQGLVMVPEGRGVFARMTIIENLQMGAFVRGTTRSTPTSTRCSRSSAPEGTKHPARRDDVRRRAADAGDGPRADGASQVLLLDEPSMGLSPIMVDKIFEVVNDIHGHGVTILLVEQNASRAPKAGVAGYVMTSGEITMAGTPRNPDDPKVRAAHPRRGSPA